MRNNQSGFILMLSAIIVTSVVIILGVSLSIGKISFKREVINSQFGSRNFVTAEACLEEGVYRLDEYANAVGYTISLNNQLCTVRIQSNSLPYKITATATNNFYTRRLEATVDNIGGDWVVLDWQEVKAMTPI